MKLLLKFDQQREILDALNAMSEREVLSGGPDPKVIRTTYKLGAENRTLVKNMRVLKQSIQTWQETQNAILRESFPDALEGQQITREENPVAFDVYIKNMTQAALNKDEIELIQFSDKLMYETDFPAKAVATLDLYGLIADPEEAAEPRHLREVK
jgi:hypothetical protein